MKYRLPCLICRRAVKLSAKRYLELFDADQHPVCRRCRAVAGDRRDPVDTGEVVTVVMTPVPTKKSTRGAPLANRRVKYVLPPKYGKSE